MVPLLGVIAGCHCSVLWWGEGRVTANFVGVDVVPCGSGSFKTLTSNCVLKNQLNLFVLTRFNCFLILFPPLFLLFFTGYCTARRIIEQWGNEIA